MFGMIRNSTILNGARKNAIQSRLCSTVEEPKRLEKTINTVQLLGRVGNNPQLRGTESHPVVTFSMATHTNYKVESGGWAQRTDWHQIVVFKSGLRELTMNYCTSGKRVLLFGKILYGDIKDREGNSRQTVSVVADDITFFQ